MVFPKETKMDEDCPSLFFLAKKNQNAAPVLLVHPSRFCRLNETNSLCSDSVSFYAVCNRWVPDDEAPWAGTAGDWYYALLYIQ